MELSRSLLSSYRFALRISFLLQQIQNFLFEVTLYDDFTVLGAAAYTALAFQHSAQFFQVVVGTDKAGNESHDLATAILAVELHFQLLSLGGQGFGLFFACRFVAEVGVSGVDHVQAVLPIVVSAVFCHINESRLLIWVSKVSFCRETSNLT